MATYYSDLIGADGDNDTTLPAVTKINSPGSSHGRVRYKRASVTAMPLTTDTVRMMTMRSGDRLRSLTLSTDANSTAGAVNVGLYLRGGPSHGGAVVDADLFASAVDTTTAALDQTDVLVEAATIVGTDRGKTLWEMAALGDGTDTSDPVVEYDIVITPSTSLTVADSILVLEAEYVAGD